MVHLIQNSASFEDAMNDVFNLVDDKGINTASDKVCVYMRMNGLYDPNGSARVDTRVFVNESETVISNDILVN